MIIVVYLMCVIRYWLRLLDNRKGNVNMSKQSIFPFDIGVVGAFTAPNYGAHLTQYALYSYLKSKGYSVLMIDKYNVPGLFITCPYEKEDICKGYNNLVSMKELNEVCESFVVGSDQLWNWTIFYNAVYVYTLLFVDSNRRKISYSTSMGKRNIVITPEESRYMKYALKRFTKISVREESGVDICKERFNVEAEWVMDPVFLPERSVYDDLIAKSSKNPPEHYIFCYIIFPDEKTYRLIDKIAKKTGWSVVCVGDAGRYQKQDWKMVLEQDVKVEDWLKLIQNSELVIADSFHAYCFALIFERRIISVSNVSTRLERMKSIAKNIGLESPVGFNEIDDWSADQILEYTQRDYSEINKKLKAQVKRSTDWLEDALHAEVKYDSTDELFDAFGAEYIQQKIIINDLLKDQRKRQLVQDGQFNGEIVLFGVGGHFRNNYKKIAGYVNVDYLSDNNQEQWNKYIKNKKCIPPTDISSLKDPLVIITIENPEIVEAVKKQLQSLGVKRVIDLQAFWERC